MLLVAFNIQIDEIFLQRRLVRILRKNDAVEIKTRPKKFDQKESWKLAGKNRESQENREIRIEISEDAKLFFVVVKNREIERD